MKMLVLYGCRNDHDMVSYQQLSSLIGWNKSCSLNPLFNLPYNLLSTLVTTTASCIHSLVYLVCSFALSHINGFVTFSQSASRTLDISLEYSRFQYYASLSLNPKMDVINLVVILFQKVYNHGIGIADEYGRSENISCIYIFIA